MSRETIVHEHACRPTAIAGLVVIEPRHATDERGTVREIFRSSAYESDLQGFAGSWSQVNLTATHHGAVRGLHGEAMNKLVTVACGTALGVYVDARPDSATVGSVVTQVLVPGVQVYVPRGVCNGFQATAPGITEYLYMFDQEWAPGMPGVAITPLDPELAIEWPHPIDVNDRAQISLKDATASSLSALLA